MQSTYINEVYTNLHICSMVPSVHVLYFTAYRNVLAALLEMFMTVTTFMYKRLWHVGKFPLPILYETILCVLIRF